MTLDETISSLTNKFHTRYGKKFAELNRNVYPTAKTDKGGYDVPVPVLGPGGGTLVTGAEGAIQLKPAAAVSVQFKTMKPQVLIYRIAIPYNECEIAAEKPEYFNYLFDAVVSKALGNYEKTVGEPDKVRFGEFYCTYERPGTEREVFKQAEDSTLELRLFGSWASNEEQYD